MTPDCHAPIFAGVSLVAVLVMLELGRRVGIRRLAQDPEGARIGTGVIDGAAFTLLGLLVTFTFSSAAARFDARRHLIIDEANHIATAWLRIDLLPPDAQPRMRELFREYLDARLGIYRASSDPETAGAELARSINLQREIWAESVAACARGSSPAVTALVLAELNDMIDITTTRSMSAFIHPPPVVFVMLAVASWFSALLAGIGMAGGKTKSWLHFTGFAILLATTMYVIMDLEYPRYGLIRVDAFDQVLINLRESMN